MERRINENIKGIHVEKITNESFDDIIGHDNSERKYFTVENNDIIYKRLKSEVSIMCLPYLGPCVDFGMGDICIEEAKDNFKFYVIDRATKFEYREFRKIEDAVQKLVSYYKENELVDNSDKMEEIFFQTLNLKKDENTKCENKGLIKVLKQKRNKN